MIMVCPPPLVRPEQAIGEIAFVGQDFRAGISAASATVPLPEHEPGDLILAYVWHTGGSTLPTLDGAAGHTEIGDGYQSATTGLRVAWKYAGDDEEDIGANTSPGNWVAIAQVFRPTRRLIQPIGAIGWSTTSAGNTVAQYPGLTLEQPDIGSVVAAALVSRANVGLEPRAGIANGDGKRSGGPRAEFGTSAGVVTAWSQVNQATAGNSETAGIAIELVRRTAP